VTPKGQTNWSASYSPGGTEDPEVYVIGPVGPASVHAAGGHRYLWPALGDNIVAATDAAGAPVSTASYDAWGLRSAAGGDQLFGYAGERQDPATGLVFLRARWYDPGTGRFLTPDEFGADSADPRTLHRYLYAFGNPLNRTDPTGQFTLASLSVSMNIQDVLRSIQSAIRYCFQEEVKRKIYRAVAKWTAKKAMKAALESTLEALAKKFATGAGSFPLEVLFHKELAKILCGHQGRQYGKGPLASLFKFEVAVDHCGNDRPRSNRNGAAHYADCFDQLVTHTGIDIVFANVLPIELKLRGGTFKEWQLTRYCRYGAKHNVYTAVYAFVFFPTDQFHEKAAKACWKCWKGSNCGSSIGSIYIAFGVKKNSSSGKRFYITQKATCAP
jgi:RHS repeat-associated protein